MDGLVLLSDLEYLQKMQYIFMYFMLILSYIILTWMPVVVC